jgi:hypothetical protein
MFLFFPSHFNVRNTIQHECKPSAEGLARRPEGESQSLLFAEVQPVFAKFLCKFTQNPRIITIFATIFIIVYKQTQQNRDYETKTDFFRRSRADGTDGM